MKLKFKNEKKIFFCFHGLLKHKTFGEPCFYESFFNYNVFFFVLFILTGDKFSWSTWWEMRHMKRKNDVEHVPFIFTFAVAAMKFRSYGIACAVRYREIMILCVLKSDGFLWHESHLYLWSLILCKHLNFMSIVWCKCFKCGVNHFILLAFFPLTTTFIDKLYIVWYINVPIKSRYKINQTCKQSNGHNVRRKTKSQQQKKVTMA